MQLILSIVLCNLLSACFNDNVGPTVVIVPFETDADKAPWSDADVVTVTSGARAWTELGFVYTLHGPADLPYEGDLPRCQLDWSQSGMTDCAMPVGVTLEVGLVERYGVVGLANRADDIIIIDSRFHGRELQSISAHEFGHILLDTNRHLDDGDFGVMMPYLGGFVSLTDADLDLACQELQICVQ